MPHRSASIIFVVSSLICLAPWAMGPLVARANDLASLVARISALGGQTETSADGKITSIDLANRPATDADVELIASDAALEKLTLWGPGITDAGIAHLAPLTKLTELSLENT